MKNGLTMTTKTLMTSSDLLALPDDGLRHELIEGEITNMTPAGPIHGKVAANLLVLIGSHIRAHDLGSVYAAETGFIIASDPDTVRAPDLAFVSKVRESEVNVPRGFARGAPDLVAEVISPDDTYEELDLKVQQWLRAGTRLVWVVNPRSTSVAVHGPAGEVTLRGHGDMLDGGDVLPGFACRISEIFL